jgi:glycosyltransferase involved in cell wall biosynthesis
MSRPLVSIVVPTYNRAAYVEEAVDSLIEQDYDALEVIALDDGSKDDSAAVLARLAERCDPDRFRWVRHDNMGQAATINRGLGLARGDLLGYLSSDDYLLPGAIDKLVAAVEQDPMIEVVYPWFHVVDDNDRVVDTIKTLQHGLRDAVRWAHCMPGVGALMHRRCYERIGGWDERYRFCPDFEWWIRARNARFHCVPEALGAWRRHEGSISTGALDIGFTHELLRILDELYADPEVPAEILEVKDEAYASAYTLGAIVLGRGSSEFEADRRFSIEDRLAPRQSRWTELYVRDEVVARRHASRATERERDSLRRIAEQQQLAIRALTDAVEEREVRIRELESTAVGAPARRPLLLRVVRAMVPPALRPRIGASVHRLLRSRS